MLDKIIKNVKVISPNRSAVVTQDIGIKDEKITQLGQDIDPSTAKEVYDGKGMQAFPGLVDAHMHTGIYSHLKDDAITESKAAAMGGVTSSLNYMRTGNYYLNKTGPYDKFFPEVLEISQGKFHVDYAYHIAPIMYEHREEVELLIEKYGVTSFKIFMFYGSHGLHGKATKGSQNDFLMTPEGENYDIAHFEFIMRSIQQAIIKHPDKKDEISLSLHCETAEIMRAYTEIVEREGTLSGLRAYSASRPPHSEGLAIFIAAYLANETACPNINLLHLTSKKAVDAAMMMQSVFPHINFKKEVTVGHLLLDVDSPAAGHAKVNPPIRDRENVEYLWEKLLDGQLDWVCSDHACCSEEFKLDNKNPDNIFLAKSGFGGTEYLLSGLHTEGTKRGMTLQHIAQLVSWNPAKRYGLRSKGDIAIGYDADIVLYDPNDSFVVRAAESESAQGYTPFEGMELGGKVKSTFLRGNLVYENGSVVGEAKGKYLKRPY